MIKVENVDVWGFESAIRGMRNPMNSWDKSDSKHCNEIPTCSVCRAYNDGCTNNPVYGDFIIGKNDLYLMRRLYKAGTEHRTYARMVQVSMDIVAPLYWWKEMDRYTVGKSQVSCSTMHKIAAKEFELDDFSHEHLSDACLGISEGYAFIPEFVFKDLIDTLNQARKKYIETKDKKWWWQMIQLLPSSYNQRRTVCMSYETVFKIIRERTGHKLDEWKDFCIILKELPYVKEIIGD